MPTAVSRQKSQAGFSAAPSPSVSPIGRRGHACYPRHARRGAADHAADAVARDAAAEVAHVPHDPRPGVLAADVQPAEAGDLVVDHEQLAVVAVPRPPAELAAPTGSTGWNSASRTPARRAARLNSSRRRRASRTSRRSRRRARPRAPCGRAGRRTPGRCRRWRRCRPRGRSGTSPLRSPRTRRAGLRRPCRAGRCVPSASSTGCGHDPAVVVAARRDVDARRDAGLALRRAGRALLVEARRRAARGLAARAAGCRRGSACLGRARSMHRIIAGAATGGRRAISRASEFACAWPRSGRSCRVGPWPHPRYNAAAFPKGSSMPVRT